MGFILEVARGLLLIVGALVAAYAAAYVVARGVVDGINASGGINHGVVVMDGKARLTGGHNDADER